MSKRRNRRLRGRALAAAAATAQARSAELLRLLDQRDIRIRDLMVKDRYAKSDAADALVKWLAEDEGFKERMVRSYMRETADRLGQMLGAEFGRQFAMNRPIFEQVQLARDAYMQLANAALDVRGCIETIPREGMVLRADFSIPPLHRAFQIKQ